MTLKRKTLREQIKEILLQRITSGTLKPGDRLIEMRIAEELDTSQAPVREALRELQAIGFVTIRPHRGTVVRKLPVANLQEIHMVQGALQEAAIRAATPIFAGDVRLLQVQVNAMTRAAMNSDFMTAHWHCMEYHRLIIENAANQVLISVWNSLQAEMQPVINTPASGIHFSASAHTYQLLTDAIASGDVEQACMLVRTHSIPFKALSDSTSITLNAH